MRDLTEYLFVIPGACPPKGSRTPVGRGRATRESSKRVKPWMDAAVRRMLDGHGKPRASFSGPVYVGLTFYFKRPKVTEHEFPTAPNIGDLDKLVRCVLDALTRAAVIEDDRFVVELRGAERAPAPRKLWGGGDVTLIEVGQAALDVPPRAVNPFALLGIEVGPSLRGRGTMATISEEPTYQGGPELPPPVEREAIESDVGGWVDKIPGPIDYGVCPRCERAPLKPGDNHSGVKCSSDTCDYWFCY